MRLVQFTLGVLLSFGALPAVAQSNLGQTGGNGSNDGAIAVPPAPLIAPSPAPNVITPFTPPPDAAPPPGLVQTPMPPVNMDNGGSAPDNAASNPAAPTTSPATPPAASGAAPASVVPPALPSTWQPGTTAQLGVLDKIDGGTSEVSVPVGGQSKVGDLQVSVLACVSHPPDQLPDAAVFIAVQSTAPDASAPLYRGWMLRSAPGAAVVGDASETFRVIGCS